MGPSPAYSYSTCVAQVAVDVETGEVVVEKLWMAHDVGQSINPLLVAGQVEGGAYMGYGEAVMEQQVFRKGRHKIPSLLDYKLPTTLDTPEIETILIEIPDREGPFGPRRRDRGRSIRLFRPSPTLSTMRLARASTRFPSRRIKC